MKYKELFTIEVIHDYFADGVAQGISLAPTGECERVLAGCGLLAKSLGNRLYVFAKTLDGVKPSILLPATLEMAFTIELTSPDFFPRSNLPFVPSQQARYSFTNLQDASLGGRNHLHSLNPLFSSSNAYAAGEFVRDGANDCYECLVNLAPGTSALNDDTKWRNCGAVAYADVGHTVRCASGSDRFTLPAPSAQPAYEIFGLNPANNQFDVSVRAGSFRFEVPVDGIVIPFEDLPEALYRVRIDGTDTMVFHRPSRDWYGLLGFVHVFHNAAAAASYALVQPDGTMNSPLFTIRIAPRSSLWRYVSRTSAVRRVWDESSAIAFEADGPKAFISSVPARLREAQYDKISIEYNNTDPIDPTKKIDIRKIAVPGYRHARRTIKNSTEYTVSELFLNY